MNSSGPVPRVREGEEGYILVGVIILLAIFMILMSVAIPKLREDIRRDQEVETIRRGQQYVRALQLFYRRFHRYPASIDQLEDTNGLRFLRKRYADPLTRSDDWKPVHLGENRAPLTMGFFGAVLNAGTALPNSSRARGQDSILGSPPASAFDPIPSDTSGSGDNSQSSPSMALGAGPMIGIRPSKAMASILVYKTKSNYEEWEFVYDPAADPMIPKWDTGTYIGAPGVSPQ
jgi:type II secretory pathway pseudopilin PulG